MFKCPNCGLELLDDEVRSYVASLNGAKKSEKKANASRINALKGAHSTSEKKKAACRLNGLKNAERIRNLKMKEEEK